MMLKLRSEVNFLLKFFRQYRTLVYIIILLLGYCSSHHRVSAAGAEDGETHSIKEQSDTSLPCSKRISKNSEVELATIKTEENGGLRQARAITPCVVAFGTEGTIWCEQSDYEVELGRSYAIKHSEIPHFWKTSLDGDKSVFFFLPHLRILFDYLLSQGVRIVFSSYNFDTDSPRLLRSFWGSEKYEELKSQGQFHVYSGLSVMSRRRDDREGRYFKDLEKVMQLSNESVPLSHAILVDGHSEECHPDQQPFIFVRTFYPGTDRDDTRLNSVYYILGLFKTYFENEKYQKLPVRTAFQNILPVNFGLDEDLPKELLRWDGDHPFVREMMNVGLSAVREEVPNATLYIFKRFGPWWDGNV